MAKEDKDPATEALELMRRMSPAELVAASKATLAPMVVEGRAKAAGVEISKGPKGWTLSGTPEQLYAMLSARDEETDYIEED